RRLDGHRQRSRVGKPSVDVAERARIEIESSFDRPQGRRGDVDRAPRHRDERPEDSNRTLYPTDDAGAGKGVASGSVAVVEILVDGRHGQLLTEAGNADVRQI